MPVDVSQACGHPTVLLHGQETIFSSQKKPEAPACTDLAEDGVSLAAHGRGQLVCGVPQPFAGAHWRAHRDTCPRRIRGSRGAPVSSLACPSLSGSMCPGSGRMGKLQGKPHHFQASELLQCNLDPTYPSDALRQGECTVKERMKNAQLLKLCRHKAAQASCHADAAGPHA